MLATSIQPAYVAVFQCPSAPDNPRYTPHVGRIRERSNDKTLYDVTAVADYSASYKVMWRDPDGVHGPFAGVWFSGSDAQVSQPSFMGLTQGPTLQRVSDGLSQTILLGEMAGRPTVYVRRTPVPAEMPGAKFVVPHVLSGEPENFLTQTFNRDLWGLEAPQPSEAVNFTNAGGLYGFHTGAVTARADGSVHLQSMLTDLRTLARLLSRSAAD